MSEAKRRIVLKKLPAHKTIWHPESTLVFKSQKVRKVVGRMVEGELLTLDEECLARCEEWNFKPDESMIQEESEGSEKQDDCDAGVEEGGEEEEDTEDEQEDQKDELETRELEKVSSSVRDDANVLAQVSTPIDTALTDVDTAGEDETQILSFTNNFTAELSVMVKALSRKLSAKDAELVLARGEIKALSTDLADSQQKYDAIHNKFEAMKSLFN